MARLEDITEKVHDGYFVDLFVRASNAVAISMYTKVLPPCSTISDILRVSPKRATLDNYSAQMQGESVGRVWQRRHVSSCGEAEYNGTSTSTGKYRQ